MAALNKLAIRGIRSFDDKSIAVIEFYSPVTVIVGHNGSGKTTIIECLKYATTGDQPSNTKGGAFIHDPKMANEKEVKAQVKLRFRAANGRRMLAIRNLSVTLKKNNAVTMKTLENVLAVIDSNLDKGGKRGVLSTKCAEIDAEIPHLLGVSKSVLENVIFCHQEDSYWPLSEPSTLKKKFDDIFEATRYTKALENIKNLRKERVSELKVDKERLQSYSMEKGHADKLKARISELTASIVRKQGEHGELGKQLQQLVVQNQKLQDSSTKFRETFVKFEALTDKVDEMERDLQSTLQTLTELPDSEEELKDRMKNFDRHNEQLKQRRARKQLDLNREEEDQSQNRREHLGLMQQQGQLQAGQKTHEKNIENRGEMIRILSSELNIQGFDHSPLTEDEIEEFRRKLKELQRRQKIRLDDIQKDGHAAATVMETKHRDLQKNMMTLSHKRDTNRETITTLVSQIKSTEEKLDSSDSMSSALLAVRSEIEEKTSRLERVKEDLSEFKYEARSSELNSQARELENRRETLNQVLGNIGLQTESRVKLDMSRGHITERAAEIHTILEASGLKFKRFTGIDIMQDNMEQELDRVISETERECDNLQREADSCRRTLLQLEATLSDLTDQVTRKRSEATGLERKLKSELEDALSLEHAIKEATTELNVRKETSGTLQGTSMIYESFLKAGKAKKICTACNRKMNEKEVEVFENYLVTQMKKTSSDTLAANEEEAREWEAELTRLQALLPVEAQLQNLRFSEIPALEKQRQEQEQELPQATNLSEKTTEKLEQVKKDNKELGNLKQQALQIGRLASEIAQFREEVTQLENELSKSGLEVNTKNVQYQLDELSVEIRKLDRDKQSLVQEYESKNQNQRRLETELHKLQLRETHLQSDVRERGNLEDNISRMQKEIGELNIAIKEVEEKIGPLQALLNTIEDEQKVHSNSMQSQLQEAQGQMQSLKHSTERLDVLDKVIEEYVRGKFARNLRDCSKQIGDLEDQIANSQKVIENIRASLAELDRELNESGSSMSTLYSNLRVRELRRKIALSKAQIQEIDLEAAGKAREEYEGKYQVAKEQETQVQSRYARIGGELATLEEQLSILRKDAKQYQNITKLYKEQLIKVKMSEMANDDLEKYGKALDNAIMKYHSLKMEEVNDTMRHLWNKTYQGTDIDGIKIRSDNEGASNKRSYNYRVVMTKDQVEMDMRGRCSAGQKMLASIIIRLALADSFGQNCGILALDEPTNALDVDNIDALASSLIDIINERKNIANFQLIIITHDENFLQKLSQQSVMEYYWRVSRDSRQKSIIERQRVR